MECWTMQEWSYLQCKNEANYYAAYFSCLCVGELLFGDAGSYTFLSNGYVAVPGINDTNEYEDTVEAMNIMGMPVEEQTGMWSFN